MRKDLPIPPHFNLAACAEWSYRPREQAIFTDAPSWAKSHAIRPSGSDRHKVHLLLIDLQRDLTHPKGGNPLTENYSVFRPEVLTRFDGKPLDQKNAAFIERLLTVDVLAIAGQADSHCVASTIRDLIAEIAAIDPTLAQKVYVLTDCMSAVAVPDGRGSFVVDFTPQAEAAHKAFADAGMHLVKSTDPIDSWPDIKL